MARKISVADSAIAQAALDEIHAVFISSGLDQEMTFVEFLLNECASKIRFQPSTRQVVLTFDLDMSGEQSAGGTVTPIQ